MPPTRPPYSPEFREEAVRLMRSSEKSTAQISRELGVSEQTLRNWRNHQEIDAGARERLTIEEREELRRLRRENKTLKQGGVRLFGGGLGRLLQEGGGLVDG